RRAVALSCANGDHKWIVAGCCDRAEAVASVHAKTSKVSGSDDHNDAVLPGCFDCLAERILGVARWNSPAKREVDDADVVSVLQSDRLLDRRNDSAIRARTVSIQGAQIDQAGFRRYSGIMAAGKVTIAGDDPRNVGAMTVEVVLRAIGIRRRRAREILVIKNTRACVCGIPQVRVGVVDAAVTHSD